MLRNRWLAPFVAALAFAIGLFLFESERHPVVGRRIGAPGEEREFSVAIP